MGLATPTSIMVGTGSAAEMGVLFRKGDALQMLQESAVVALDKTGTLTAGRPALTDLILADGLDEDEVLGIVASVEQNSEHPIAEAIVAAAHERGDRVVGHRHVSNPLPVSGSAHRLGAVPCWWGPTVS